MLTDKMEFRNIWHKVTASGFFLFRIRVGNGALASSSIHVNEPSVARFEILTVVLMKISIGLLGCDGGGTTPLRNVRDYALIHRMQHPRRRPSSTFLFRRRRRIF
jgi:hypothetical protein